ncbi:Acyl-CoA N-acyltransferases (Nat) [Glarea lozoyensis ATCC 20868]|uniref:Acyl-CoA N-acyltransferases (Nat) n=2 Tax=Glarea lozoyensis TaxID=101852 RepID=S3DFE1_GLAL2|nr:Acyl-CoA N-acyltransferases (Nat) [Glarea lozoyensis ATCC 20868]EHK96426.1 hypothetical protein M7I_7875 [Glarea lozoyensis 74030]EPE37137.1 Acyl-CoA N-acyltransferases (Nat) [Glarea lozoyensis ATCC 20868]
MPLSLHIIPSHTPHDFTPITTTEDLAYRSPYNTFYELLRGSSLADFTTRQAAAHVGDPSSFWCYVVDDATGVVAGAMGWNLHEEVVDWRGVEVKAEWLEGEEKELADLVFEQFFGGRGACIGTPHLLISYCFTHPSYRRQGVGRQMMAYGLAIADAKGLPTWVESTECGRVFYESCGFEMVNALEFEVERVVGEKEGFEKRTGLELPEGKRWGWVLKREVKEVEEVVEDKDKVFL